MATKTVTLSCVRGARIYSAGGGAGGSSYLPVGLWSGSEYRSLVEFAEPDYTAIGATKLVSAKLRLRNSTQFYVGRGATPRLYANRILEAWSEGSSDTLSNSNSVTWANQPNSATTGRTDSGTLSTSDSVTVDIDITGTYGYLLPTSVKRADGSAGGGAKDYGFLLYSFDAASTSRTTEFASDDHPTTSARPVLILVFETNNKPAAPTGVSPATEDDGTGSIAPVSSGSFRVKGTRSDPDTGDYITAVQVQTFADTATDATPGTPIYDVTIPYTTSPTTFDVPVSSSGLTVGGGTSYRLRVRTRDKANEWGPYSPLAAGRFVPNTVPSAPSNMAVDAATQTPNFYGSLVDADAGATLSEVLIEVEQVAGTSTVSKWPGAGWQASGGTRFTIAYGGTTLDYGTTYRWRAKVRDNLGSESAWSSWQSWTPVSVAGPTAMSPITVETIQNTLTPVLTVGNGGSFTNHELQVAKYGDGTSLLWNVTAGTAYASTTSKAVTYAGAALTWGRQFYWRARVLVGGVTWSEWSTWYPFYVNALPNAPVLSIDTAVSSGSGTYGPYVTVIGTTPTIRAPYSDPDIDKGYTGVVRTGQQIELRDASTGVAVSGYGNKFVTTSSDTHTVTSGLLSSGSTYKVRWRDKDASGVYGPWSEWLFFKVSTAAIIGAGTAVSVSDPTPTLAWTLNRTQRAYRVLVYVNATSELIHDSGLVYSATTSYVLPGGLLTTATGYRWTVTAYDLDMQPSVLS